MIRGLLTLAPLISLIFFPWPFTAMLALIAAGFEPLAPLAAGIFADVLYYSSYAQAWPRYTLYGAVATLAAYLVRRQLSKSIIGG